MESSDWKTTENLKRENMGKHKNLNSPAEFSESFRLAPSLRRASASVRKRSSWASQLDFPYLLLFGMFLQKLHSALFFFVLFFTRLLSLLFTRLKFDFWKCGM